jgi:glycosyltransferase involved in cell wall biosynthesis
MKKRNGQDLPVIMMVIGALNAGGKERQLIILLKNLQLQRKFSTILVVMNPNGDMEESAAQYADEFFVIDRSQKKNVFKIFSKLIKISRENNVDLIQSWGSGFWDLVCMIVAKVCYLPFLHYGIQSAPARLNIDKLLSKFAALFANVIAANSYAGLSAFGLSEKPNAMVIYNGLDLERFEDYSTTKDQQFLCMVANFRKEKDHETMVRALREIVDEYPDISLILVGHDFGTLESTRRLVSSLKLENNVEYITDTMNPEPFIAKSAVCILSTFGEGISNVLLEYMALERPVVVSNNGGNPEVVTDGVNGFLVEPQSSEAISARVIELLKDKEKAVQMGLAGRKMVEEKFSTDKMVSAFNNLYKDLINR